MTDKKEGRSTGGSEDGKTGKNSDRRISCVVTVVRGVDSVTDKGPNSPLLSLRIVDGRQGQGQKRKASPTQYNAKKSRRGSSPHQGGGGSPLCNYISSCVKPKKQQQQATRRRPPTPTPTKHRNVNCSNVTLAVLCQHVRELDEKLANLENWYLTNCAEGVNEGQSRSGSPRPVGKAQDDGSKHQMKKLGCRKKSSSDNMKGYVIDCRVRKVDDKGTDRSKHGQSSTSVHSAHSSKNNEEE